MDSWPLGTLLLSCCAEGARILYEAPQSLDTGQRDGKVRGEQVNCFPRGPESEGAVAGVVSHLLFRLSTEKTVEPAVAG